LKDWESQRVAILVIGILFDIILESKLNLNKGGIILSEKVNIIVVTVAFETVILWLVTLFFGWSLIETLFLGGLAIFGVVWLFQLNVNQTNNEYNATAKGFTGKESGVIKPFQFSLSPITLGLLLFLMVSFLITVITYYPYFKN